MATGRACAPSGHVEFVDMHELGHNPSRIMPAWQHFLDAKARQRSPIRGIGEPIGRGAALKSFWSASSTKPYSTSQSILRSPFG